jgi:hypothetical protein
VCFTLWIQTNVSPQRRDLDEASASCLENHRAR